MLGWAIFSPDGETTLTATTNPDQVNFWDRATRQRTRPPLAHESWIRRLTVSPDGNTIITATELGKIRLWENASGRFRETLVHEGPTSLCFSPNGQSFVSSSQLGTVRLCDTATGRILQTFTHPAACIEGVLNADGSLYLTGCNAGAARLWVVATGNLAGRPRSHSSAIIATCFHTDGRSYLTGTEGREVQRWDIALGKALGPPIRLPQSIRGLTAAPPATVLIRAEGSPTAILYHTPTAVPGDVTRIKLSLQILTALKMDADGTTQVLTASDLKACREELARQGGDPFAPVGR